MHCLDNLGSSTDGDGARRSLRIQAKLSKQNNKDSDVDIETHGNAYTTYTSLNSHKRNRLSSMKDNDNINNNDNVSDTHADMPPKKRLKLQAELSRTMKSEKNVSTRLKTQCKVPPEFDGKFSKDRLGIQHRGGSLLQFSHIRLTKDVRKMRLITNLTITNVNNKHYFIEKNRLQSLEQNNITDNFRTTVSPKSKLPGSMTWTSDCENTLPETLRPKKINKNSMITYYGTALQAAINEYLVCAQKANNEMNVYCDALARTGLPNEYTYYLLVADQQPKASEAGKQKAAKVWHDFDVQMMSLWYLNKPLSVSIDNDFQIMVNAKIPDTITKHCGGYQWDKCGDDYDGLKLMQFVGVHKFGFCVCFL